MISRDRFSYTHNFKVAAILLVKWTFCIEFVSSWPKPGSGWQIITCLFPWTYLYPWYILCLQHIHVLWIKTASLAFAHFVRILVLSLQANHAKLGTAHHQLGYLFILSFYLFSVSFIVCIVWSPVKDQLSDFLFQTSVKHSSMW